MGFESPGILTTMVIANNNEDDGKQPYTKLKKHDELNPGLAKHKIDWAINESETLLAESNDNLDVKQPTQMNK